MDDKSNSGNSTKSNQEEPKDEEQPMSEKTEKEEPTTSEEEEEPSSPLKTIIISLVLLAVNLGIGFASQTVFECLVSLGVNIVVFLFIAWPLHTEKYYDFTGMITFLSCDISSILYHQVKWNIDNIRNIVLCVMVMCWTLRLGIFLFKRISAKHGGTDKRFDGVRDNFFAFLVAWLLQATWAFFCCMPLFIVNQIDNEDVHKQGVNNITVLDIIGWFLWVFGWAFEIISDRQKSAFKDDPNNRGKFTYTGLWKWSRHPNYFGEITLWFGIFISSASVARNAGWLVVLSPIWTIILLVFVSGIPIAERTSMKKYGADPLYVKYVEEVSVLVPFPCCWKGYI